MTRTFTLIFVLMLLLAFGLMFSPVLAENKGYVLLTVAGWKVEMTLVSALIIAGLVAFLWWLAFKVFRTFTAMGSWSWHWFADFGKNRQQLNFEKGLIALLSMDFDNAEKHLQKVSLDHQNGIVPLLLSHCAAQRNDEEAQRQALQQAQKFVKTKEAANLLLARFFQTHNDPKAAVELLQDSEHKMALELKLKAMARDGNWQQVSDLLDSNKKKFDKAQFNQWKREASVGLLSEKASKEGAEVLLQYWQSLPGKTRKDVSNQYAFVLQLIEQNYHQKAEEYLVQFQSRARVPELLPLFRKLKLRQPLASKQKLEAWLKQDENDAELLSTLGELSYNSGDALLAEKVLQKAIKLRNNLHDVQMLAKVKEATNDKDQALQLYKQVTESQTS